MASYNAETGTVNLEAGDSLYALAHERAHEIQHDAGTKVWVLHARLRRVPILSHASRLLVEWEAAMMARRVLIELGAWTPQLRREMVAGLLSYARPY